MKELDFGKMAKDYLSGNELKRVPPTEIKPIWQLAVWTRKFIVVPDVFNQSSNRYFLGTYVALQSLHSGTGYVITSIKQIINLFGENPRMGGANGTPRNVDFVRDALNGLGYLGVIDEYDYSEFTPEQEFCIRVLFNDEIIDRFQLKLRRFDEKEIPRYRTKRFNSIISADILGYRLFKQTQETVAPGHRIKFPRYIRCISMIRRCMRVLEKGQSGLKVTVCGTRIRASTLADLLGMSVKGVRKLLENLEISEVFRVKQLADKKEKKDDPLYSIVDWVGGPRWQEDEVIDDIPMISAEMPVKTSAEKLTEEEIYWLKDSLKRQSAKNRLQ